MLLLFWRVGLLAFECWASDFRTGGLDQAYSCAGRNHPEAVGVAHPLQARATECREPYE